MSDAVRQISPQLFRSGSLNSLLYAFPVDSLIFRMLYCSTLKTGNVSGNEQVFTRAHPSSKDEQTESNSARATCTAYEWGPQS